jgi:hypothetical protein
VCFRTVYDTSGRSPSVTGSCHRRQTSLNVARWSVQLAELAQGMSRQRIVEAEEGMPALEAQVEATSVRVCLLDPVPQRLVGDAA